MNILETSIRRLTCCVNGQFPRPWMTDVEHPEKVRIFIVGYNQATSCAAELIAHDAYIDALFNRNGRSCCELYKLLRGDAGPSRTHGNIDILKDGLAARELTDVIVTNAIFYSTPMSGDLAEVRHQGGKALGREIFVELLEVIRPAVLIAHGARTTRELGRVLFTKLPPAASKQEDGVSCVRVHTKLRGGPSYAPMVFVIPSLAPPKWNSWQAWAQPHLTETCDQVRETLSMGG